MPDNPLLYLAARVEALAGPDRAVDAEITILLDRRPDWLARSSGRMWFDPGRRGSTPPTIRWLDNGQRRGPGNPTAWPSDWPEFTGSIDAAKSSINPLGYPLWTLRTETRSNGQHGMTYSAELCVAIREFQGYSRANLACALLAAMLRARAADGGQTDG